ncbi:hypothetical protein EMCRGX_G023257 [Ephydatia muelleri]
MVTDRTGYALQEYIRRELQRALFVLAVGVVYRYVAIETSISGEVARKFAVATGSSVTLHEHSVPYLQADYDPFHTIESSRPGPQLFARVFHSIEKMDIRSRPQPLHGDREMNPTYRMALECGLSFLIRTRKSMVKITEEFSRMESAVTKPLLMFASSTNCET